jgi:hypothetical protein
LTSIPGSGSARRAGPIGISGEAAMARATASSPPVIVTADSRCTERPTSLPRVMPRARQIGYSAASRVSCRLSSWPTTASAIRATSAANTASATASGRMARCVAATWSDRLSASMAPPVSGYFLASAPAALRNAAMLAPGLSRTPACGPYVNDGASREAVNDGFSRAIGSLLVAVLGTIWLSKIAIAETRKSSGTASRRSGAPVLGLSGSPSRRSVPPGRRFSRLASCGSMTASPTDAGPNMRPCKILTRSAVAPSARLGLASVCTKACGRPCRAGSAMLYWTAVDIDATSGSRAKAAKYAGVGAPA